MSVDIAASVAKAFAIAKRAGLAADVVFTSTTSTHNESTDVMTDPVETTIAGVAVRDEGDPELYEALGLIDFEQITLVFQAATRGQKPPLGASVEWEGAPRVVKKVLPVAPAERTLLSTVIVV